MFHVLLIYALVTGLANSAVKLMRGELEANVVTDAQKDDTPPPPPPPDFKPPPPDVVVPEVNIDLTTAPPPTVTTTITQAAPKVEAPVVAAPPPAPPTPAVALSSHAVTSDQYPAISIRLQEQGVVAIKYLVGTDGNVQDVQITKSSGHDRLDEAAVTYAKKWKFKPATQDGKPVAFWIQANVNFQLK